MTEKTIKSYTEKGIRIQLVEITTEDTHFNQYQIPVGDKRYYQVRNNRKIRITTESYESACKLFQAIVNHFINQLKLFES